MDPLASTLRTSGDTSRHHRWRIARHVCLALVLAVPLSVAVTSSACATGGRKAQLQDRKNRVSDELRALVPAVLAAKKKARPVLAKRRLGRTGVSVRGGDATSASFKFTSVHAGVRIEGVVTADPVVGPGAAARIKVKKSGGKRGSKR